MKHSVKEKTKRANGPYGLYVKIAALITCIMILVTVAGTYIPYPTQAHRDASAKISALNSRAIKEGFTPKGGPNSDIYASKEYKDAQNSPETRYSMTTGAILILVQIVMGISLIGITYNYLRKNYVSKSRRALGATVVINVLAGTISYLATLLPTSKLTNIPMPSASEIAGATVMSLVFGFVLTFIVASIFERLYNRKHSFIVD